MNSTHEEKNNKIIDKIFSVILIIALAGLGIAIALGVIYSIVSIGKNISGMEDAIERDKITNNITAGQIIDKYSKNGYVSGGSGGLLYTPGNGGLSYGIALDDNDTYIPKRYYFKVGIEYEFNGEIIETNKDFEVERDVYLAYDIGDHFDSKNFVYQSEIPETYTTE